MIKINFFESLRITKEKFDSIRPITFIVCYIILIPIFALVYNFIPSHFYHSTIKFENSYQKTGNQICKELERDFINNIKTIKNIHGNKFIINYDSLNFNELTMNPKLIDTINLESLKLINFNSDGNYISFNLSYNIYHQIFEEENEGLYATVKNVDIKCRLSSDPYSEHVLYIEIEPKLANDPTYQVLGITKRYITPDDKEGHFELYISELSRNLLKTYINATKGIPSTMSGKTTRMLYLSASTLTTLGIGDIAPITDVSRLLVTLESILGIIVIGLFFNAVANKKSSK